MAGDAPQAVFGAAIFRRGQKVELFGDVEAEVAEAEDLEQKLGDLLAVWAAPRTGRELAAAIWRPERRCFEVVLQRGKLFSHMGFMQGSKLFLHVEEAVYLADRANLLLFLDPGGGAQQQLLSLQEAYDLMAWCGMPMSTYLVYCKLMRAGYIVQRHPAQWVLKPTDDPRRVWHMWQDASAAAPDAAPMQQPPSAAPREVPAAGAPPPPPAKRRKLVPAEQRVRHGAWWPADAVVQDCSQLPRATVAPTAHSLAAERYPNMRPLPELALLEGAALLPASFGAGRLELDLDIWRAGGARGFSRRAPGEPSFRVAVAPPGAAPDPVALAALHAAAGGVPVRVASVERGDICLYAVDHVCLRSIL